MLTLVHEKPTSRSRAATPPVQQHHTLTQSASPVIQRAPSCPCGGSCPRCLAKSTLKIGAPDDAYEREADAVADRVMRMADGAGPARSASAASGLQRKCADCENESEEPLLQAKAESSSPLAPTSARLMSAPASVDTVLRAQGQALDSETRAFFEPRFGHDLSGVRVHLGALADSSARAMHAQAYTVHNHIVFAAGRYAPCTPQGRHLIAHELAHVAQRAGTLQRQDAEAPVAVPAAEPVGYTLCDFIDERIDTDAQRALFVLYRHGGDDRAAALNMLGAVKAGRLTGILRQDRQAAAAFAVRTGSTWWQMMPPGRDAAVIESEQPPLLAYKVSLAASHQRLAPAIASAWGESVAGQLRYTVPAPSGEVCELPSKKAEPVKKDEPPPPPTRRCPTGPDDSVPFSEYDFGNCPTTPVPECDYELVDWNEKFARYETMCSASESMRRHLCNLSQPGARIPGLPGMAPGKVLKETLGMDKNRECRKIMEEPLADAIKRCVLVNAWDEYVLGYDGEGGCGLPRNSPGKGGLSDRYDQWLGS